MCNNLSLVIQMVSVAEAMNLGVKLGMDPQVLRGCVPFSVAWWPFFCGH
jgi:3-hydroxyisobutyrate dehydrogenase-like beta-hydroxyacid dehydrogenase